MCLAPTTSVPAQVRMNDVDADTSVKHGVTIARADIGAASNYADFS